MSSVEQHEDQQGPHWPARPTVTPFLSPYSYIHAGGTSRSQREYVRNEICIEFRKKRRTFVDKTPKRATAEEQLISIRNYYNSQFTLWERRILRLVLCLQPVIHISELRVSTFSASQVKTYPREVHLTHLERSDLLTAGFTRPSHLRSDANFFFETTSFDITPYNTTRSQHVLCIDHEVNKRYLIWPLSFSFILALLVAVTVGLLTRSVTSGAEAGGFVGVAIVLLWTYILWTLG